MKVGLGFKAHSGWAALVVVGKDRNDFTVVERCRVELVENEWARQPYHAAEELKSEAAKELVERGIDAAHVMAARELRAALQREARRKNDVKACAVLVGNSMPDWSVAEILAVHFRMHKAEGVLFRDALIKAAKENKLKTIEVPEKSLMDYATSRLGLSSSELSKRIAELGKAAGPPWGKDQKDAALAAMLALGYRKT